MTERARGFRLILLDLDGTLLSSSRQIHDENLRVLQELMAKGILVAFCTGRTPRSTVPYARALSPNAPGIHMNGGLVRDAGDGRVVFQRALSTEVALAALAAARAHALHANVYVGDEIWIDARSKTSLESEEKDGVPHTVIGDVAARLAAERLAPLKIMFITEPKQIPALTAAVSASVGDGAALVNSEPTYLEALPPACSKRAGAEALAAHCGLSLAEVIAFGDNKNDLELLESAGLGVAMANSHPDVLARVPTHIGHHDSDAIARFLADLELIGGVLRKKR
jgi:Cof subfamily protein (haloacid dehalogenase superfamily)